MISGRVAGIIFRIHAIFGTFRTKVDKLVSGSTPCAVGPGSQIKSRSAVVVLTDFVDWAIRICAGWWHVRTPVFVVPGPACEYCPNVYPFVPFIRICALLTLRHVCCA